MSLATDIKAGAAYVELYTKNNRLNRGLAAAQRRLRAFGASVAGLGKKIARAAAVAAAPLLIGGKLFADFEHNMARVSTMLSAADMKFMPAFRKSVKQLAIETGKSLGDITDGLYDILSAQVPAQRALEVIRAATRGAVAGRASVKDTTAALLTLMETYGDQFRNAGDASDFLFQIIRRGRTDMEQLAPAIGAVIAIAKQAGLSLEDMGASLALITRATGHTERSIVALKSITMTFLKPAKEGARLWKDKFGTAMNYATLQTEGMVSVLKKLNTLNASEVAQIFPNKRALTGLLPALAKVKDFAVDLAAMKDRAGATDEAYKKMANTMLHWVGRAKQVAIIAFVAIGEAIHEPVIKAFKAVIKYGKMVIDFISRNKKLIVAIMKIVVVAGLVGVALIVVGTALGHPDQLAQCERAGV